MKSRRGDRLTAIGGIIFGCVLAMAGLVNWAIDPTGTIPGKHGGGGFPNWISGPMLILLGLGMVIPFAIELRRLSRKE